MPLQSGAQFILQIERHDGRFDCLGFAGIPVVNPVFVVLASGGTPTAMQDLEDLRRELQQELSYLAPQIQTVSLPCGGVAPDPSICHALGDPACQKVLVLVGDSIKPLSLQPFYRAWIAGSTNHWILPVYRAESRGSIWNLLPSTLRHLNVAFWSNSITEVLPAILALSNLTPEYPRIFISYRQKDSAALAIQFFDALCHRSFDTFLDHFRIPPGVNFQTRLTQELGDKSMVLVIESESILESEWTMYEISVAKTCSLGIFAVHVPGGQFVPGIDPEIRVGLSHSQFKGGAFSPTAELDTTVLETVVEKVRFEHDGNLIRRRQILLESLKGALLEQGASYSALATDGTLRVLSHTGIEYVVWLTPRPPELPDFHIVHGQTVPPMQGVVLGLSRLMEPTRLAQTAWLAGLSQIKMVDEGHLKLAAFQMAQGVL